MSPTRVSVNRPATTAVPEPGSCAFGTLATMFTNGLCAATKFAPEKLGPTTTEFSNVSLNA